MADENNPLAERELDIETMASKLAREVARNLIPIGEIRDRFKLDEDEYQTLIRSRVFAVRLEEELELWSASTPKAATERVQMKALTMVEESMPEVYELIHDKAQPMSAKIEALKWASSMAGVSKKEVTARDLGERVKFNIYIGDKRVSFDKPLDDPKLIEGSAVLTDKSV